MSKLRKRLEEVEDENSVITEVCCALVVCKSEVVAVECVTLHAYVCVCWCSSNRKWRRKSRTSKRYILAPLSPPPTPTPLTVDFLPRTWTLLVKCAIRKWFCPSTSLFVCMRVSVCVWVSQSFQKTQQLANEKELLTQVFIHTHKRTNKHISLLLETEQVLAMNGVRMLTRLCLCVSLCVF